MLVYIQPKLREAIERKSATRPVEHCAIHFVSNLFLRAADHEDFDEYFPLMSEFSRRIYTTRNYGPMLGVLFDLRAIEVKGKGGGSYHAGQVSKSYRLSTANRLGVSPIEIDCPKLETRLNLVLERAAYAAMSTPAQRWIIESFKATTFSPHAADVLAKHSFKTPEGRARATYHVDNVKNHRVRFTVCKKSGRIYYSIANLPKRLRAELLIEGESTSEIDLVCAQPSLLSSIYIPESPSHAAERNIYLSFVQSGRFYEEVTKHADKQLTRDEAKKLFFNEIAYGSYWCEKKYELLPAFTSRFPILANEMSKFKKCGNSVLPNMMQRLEADVVINGACGECATQKIKVLPVHDALICKQSDVEVVSEILGRYWQKMTNILPKMKTSRQLAGEAAND